MQYPLTSKRFQWLAIVIGILALIVGGMVSGIFTRPRPKTDERLPVVRPKELAAPNPRLVRRLPRDEYAGDGVRESKHHATGEAEKNRRSHLEEMVEDQELVLEKKRAVLANIIRANHKDIYIESDSQRSRTTPEEAAKSDMADANYVNAKREYEAVQMILQSLKIQLISVRIAENSRNQ